MALAIAQPLRSGRARRSGPPRVGHSCSLSLPNSLRGLPAFCLPLQAFSGSL